MSISRLMDKQTVYRQTLEILRVWLKGHHSKATKWVTEMFWFPSAYKNYGYTILLSVKCVIIALCIKNVTFKFKSTLLLKLLIIVWQCLVVTNLQLIKTRYLWSAKKWSTINEICLYIYTADYYSAWERNSITVFDESNLNSNFN